LLAFDLDLDAAATGLRGFCVSQHKGQVGRGGELQHSRTVSKSSQPDHSPSMPELSSSNCTHWNVRGASLRMISDAVGSMAHCESCPNQPKSAKDGRLLKRNSDRSWPLSRMASARW